MDINDTSKPVQSNTPAAGAAPAGTSSTWPGAFDVLGMVFNQVKKNPAPALVYILVTTAAAVLSAILRDPAPADNAVANKEAFAPESLLGLVFLLALPAYGLALADRRKISLGEFMSFNARKYFNILGATILVILIIIASAMLLIFPLIWTLPWFSLFTYAIVDKDLGAIESLKQSKRMMQNNKGKFWGIVGAMIAVGIIPSIAFSLLPYNLESIVTATLSIFSTGMLAVLYRWLQHQDHA
jgi:uncharacterized membrane protein